MSTFYWAIGLTPILASLYVASAALQGLKKVLLGQVAELVIMQGSFIILFVIFTYLTPIIPSAASTMALRFGAVVLACIFTITFLLKKTPYEISSAKPVYSGKFWLTSTISLGLSGGFNTTKTLLVILFMGLFVEESDIGTFQVAVSAAALAGLALQAVNAILAPHFASLITQNDKSRLQRLVSISSFTVGLFCLIITIIFVLFGKPLLGFAFGKDLVEAYPSLLVLLAGQLVNSFAGSVGYLLNMAGYENDVLKTIIISTVMNIVLTLLLTPFWGIIGGATASSISLIYSQFSMYRLVHKRLGIISHALGLFTISWNKKNP
jgi:O-antigen/teichoic acid export membrane protein